MLNRIKDVKVLSTAGVGAFDERSYSDSSASRERSHAFRADDDEGE